MHAFGNRVCWIWVDFTNTRRSQGTYDGDYTVEVDYPAAFFDAFTSTPSYATRQQPFRYVHVSGCFVEPDQGKSLWFLSKARKGRVSDPEATDLVTLTTIRASVRPKS